MLLRVRETSGGHGDGVVGFKKAFAVGDDALDVSEHDESLLPNAAEGDRGASARGLLPGLDAELRGFS